MASNWPAVTMSFGFLTTLGVVMHPDFHGGRDVPRVG